MTKETVTFKFPKKLVRRAKIDESLGWAEIVKDPDYGPIDRLESLLYVQILDWQKKQRHVVTADTPAGADVIYTDERGEEHPAVLVAHRRNAEALIWFSPSGYSLSRAPLDCLRLAGKDEG